MSIQAGVYLSVMKARCCISYISIDSLWKLRKTKVDMRATDPTVLVTEKKMEIE